MAKKKVVKVVKKPKHLEQYSTRESNLFRPWKVDLKIELDAFDLKPVTYTVFCRCGSPTDAQWIAYKWFNIWEHGGQDSDEFPRICTVDYTTKLDKDLSDNERISYATLLTEDQWEEFIEESEFYDTLCVGPRKNPSVFHFKKEGWDNRGGILKGDGLSVFMDKVALNKDAVEKINKINKKLKK